MTYTLLIAFLPLTGIYGNACPSFFPPAIEDWGHFKLPPSFRNLESACGGMQGWFAAARFEMSPQDLDTFIDGTSIERPLTTRLDPKNRLNNDPILKKMKSYLYGTAKGGWQTVVIDTSNPDSYKVYFNTFGGH
jgi:hypothetical protein